MPGQVTDFSEDLSGSLTEYMTVYTKDDLRFMLPCEVEIQSEHRRHDALLLRRQAFFTGENPVKRYFRFTG